MYKDRTSIKADWLYIKTEPYKAALVIKKRCPNYTLLTIYPDLNQDKLVVYMYKNSTKAGLLYIRTETPSKLSGYMKGNDLNQAACLHIRTEPWPRPAGYVCDGTFTKDEYLY